MPRHIPAVLGALALAGSLAIAERPPAQAGPLRFSVTLPASAGAAPLDGRLLVIVSRVEGAEPRFQVSDGPSGQPIFGVDVDGWKPGTAATIDGSVLGATMGLFITWLLDRYEFIRIPGDVYFIDRLPVAFDWMDIGVIVALSMLISFVAKLDNMHWLLSSWRAFSGSFHRVA